MAIVGRTIAFTLSCLTAFSLGIADAGEKVVLRSQPLIELFTSQGCNSCPPADALLAELADRQDIVALSWSIDYWDYLGWRDTFAQPEHTARQRGYNQSLGLSGVYTPQLIVDGRLQTVGSRRDEVLALIEQRLTTKAAGIRLALSKSEDAVSLTLSGRPGALPATVWLVEFTDVAEQDIEDGELQGNSYTYRHVVRYSEKLGQWTARSQSFVLDAAAIAERDNDGHVVIVQEDDTGPVAAAALIPLAILP
ncbi:MAG: DUF1223 domain-containing protein [Proteobacteria bacterium]|nr:MAG: DUF1223 domain-containing protein [Pseudomonadota bacterium]